MRFKYIYIIIIVLIIFSIFFNKHDKTHIHFLNEVDTIKTRLIERKWLGECGEKILKNKIRITFSLPKKKKVGNRIVFIYDEDYFNDGGEGIYFSKPNDEIKISLYQKKQFYAKFKSQLENIKKNDIIQYGDYCILRAELIHVLIDELVSASMEGKQFIDGGASRQEEFEAWYLAEKALKSFYKNSDKIFYFNYSKPNYGKDNFNYIPCCDFLN